MKIKFMYKRHTQEGITLLVTLLLMGVLLGVSTSLLNVTLKQFQLSGFSFASEMAFQAANAGMECALYHDFINAMFVVPGDGSEQSIVQSISCMGSGLVINSNGTAHSGEEQKFQFSWGTPEVCTEVSVYKFFSSGAPVAVTVNGTSMRSSSCPAGSVCTVVQSRGYNVACSVIGTGSNVVEREYTQVY